MVRHLRNASYIHPKTEPLVMVDSDINNDTTVYVPGDVLPSIVVNTTLTSVDSFFGKPTLSLSNGSVFLDEQNLSYNFMFSGWFKIANPSISYNLLTVNSSFRIVLDSSTDTLKIQRDIYGIYVDEYTIPYIVDVDTWVLITIIRNYNKLTVYKNLEVIETIDDYFYQVLPGDTYIGDNLTADIFSVKLSTGNFDNAMTYGELDTYKNIINPLTYYTENADSKYIDLHSVDILNNSVLYPVTSLHTLYKAYGSYWDVSNALITDDYKTTGKGLVVVPKAILSKPYTLEISFKLASDTTNIVLASQWESDYSKSWFLYYNNVDNSVYFTYWDEASNTVNNIVIGEYVPNVVNHFCMVASNTITIFYNGVLIDTLEVVLNHVNKYKFNYDVNLVGNTGNSYYLYKFTVTKTVKYIESYIPYISSEDYKKPFIPTSIYNYHHKVDKYVNKILHKILLTGSTTISPGATNTYTLTLEPIAKASTVINISIKLSEYSDLVLNDLIFPVSVTIPANTSSVTFTVQLSSYPESNYKKSFKLIASNSNYCSVLDINILDIREYPYTNILSIPGYIDGFLTKDTNGSNVLSNIAKNNTIASVSTVDTLYGKGYIVNSAETALSIPTTANIRTCVLIYKELLDTAYRGYFGSTTNHTFNGGSNYELLGDIIYGANEYLTAIDKLHKVSNLAISENNQTVVIVDETSYKVLIYENTLLGWSDTPIELNLGLTDNTNVLSTSIDINTTGTVIALGFKNENSGEGVAQVWRKVSNVWVKDLHLGSPTPAPFTGAFGQSVAINDAGNILFVSQIGSNAVYIFEKTTLWNPVPIETFIGENRFGYSIDCTADGQVLVINEVDTKTTYIFKDTTSWALSQTISYGVFGKINKLGTFLALSDFLSDTVKLYNFNTTYQLVKTITGSSNFGYSLDINNNKDILIGSPEEHKIYLYLNTDNYNVATEFVSSDLDSLDFFGYAVGLSYCSVITTNYYDQIKLETLDTQSIPSNILAVRQKYNAALTSDILDKSEPQILVFYTTTNLSINIVGKTKGNMILNGIVYGWLFFNRVLSTEEITQLENTLKYILHLNTYSLYDT